MNLVITMAGKGSRFKSAGYSEPKFAIVAQNRTLFEWSMMSLTGLLKDVETSIFIVQKEDNASSFIKNKCTELNIPNPKIVEIEGLTDGQATTVLFAKQFWNKSTPLYIYNIDTYVEKNEMISSQIKGDGFIPCFQGEGDHWSFVQVDSNNKAIKVAEKKRISPYCTLGAYYFSSSALYQNLYEEYYSLKSNLVNGEKYIAPLYNLLIQQKKDVFISDIPADKVHPLGTPKEVDEFEKMK